MADLCRPRPRPDLRLADQQGGDAPIRTDLRPDPARLAGLRLPGCGRQGAGPGPSDAELLIGVGGIEKRRLRNEPPFFVIRSLTHRFYGWPSFRGARCRLPMPR